MSGVRLPLKFPLYPVKATEKTLQGVRMDNFQHCKRIGIIGGLGNEAMVDLIKKIATLPQAADCEYVIFGNSRMAYKPEEVGQHFLPDHPTEL